jgi:hypothetical protein
MSAQTFTAELQAKRLADGHFGDDRDDPGTGVVREDNMRLGT